MFHKLERFYYYANSQKNCLVQHEQRNYLVQHEYHSILQDHQSLYGTFSALFIHYAQVISTKLACWCCTL
jgi:hypothetical protein